MQELVNQIEELFIRHANADKAQQMEAYMKHHFSFFGVMRNDRKEILNQLKPQLKTFTIQQKTNLAVALWQHSNREMQHLAMDILLPASKKVTLELYPQVEQLITQKQWWDTIDLLSSHLIGALYINYPEFMLPKLEEMNASSNFWLNRITIIFQLKYKQQFIPSLFEQFAGNHLHQKEFFIQKAIGWMLREQSKINPSYVQSYLEQHPQLSNLSKREASKYLP